MRGLTNIHTYVRTEIEGRTLIGAEMCAYAQHATD